MATKSTSLIVHRALDVKNWLMRPPSVQEARPGRCPRCHGASRPTGGALGLHGHGVRDRHVLGPPEIGLAPTTLLVVCQRYLCTACGAVVMVVPRGIEPRRHYGRAAICLALALWALVGQPTTVVRIQVCARPGPATTTSWRTLRRWAAAVAAGAWPWCRTAAGLTARLAAARAAQIAAGLAPAMTPGPLSAQAYAGGAALI
jgi:hypothetical protein